jgi:xanthine dehydrogenase iron-sulfur cluster and FAD-binding subunit A
MDTIIAVIIIVLAGVYVFRRMHKSITGKSGCGCSGDCGACGGSGQNADGSCPSEKKEPLE